MFVLSVNLKNLDLMPSENKILVSAVQWQFIHVQIIYDGFLLSIQQNIVIQSFFSVHCF